jgi:NADH dehydrogenase
VTIAGERIPARTVIWAAGVKASPAGTWLGADVDRAGRVPVGPDLTLTGHPEIFVLGDTASAKEGDKSLPGVASVAMQQGRYVAREIVRRVHGQPDGKPFHYVDKGSLATIGRTYAIADIWHVELSGYPAWLVWMAVHIFYLIGFQNRVLVMMQWAWVYLTHQRRARLIVPGPRVAELPAVQPEVAGERQGTGVERADATSVRTAV